MRLVLPLAFAAVLWLLGLTIAAVLVVVAVTLLTVIGAVSPTLAGRIEHWMGRFGVFVGHVIAVVLLTIVNLFVFTPVAFLMWLFRYDPLAPGVRRDEASFWRAHAGRALPKRQFADERALWAPVGAAAPRRRRPILRVATVVGVVTLILAADLAAGWIYDQVSNETHGTAAVASDAFDPSAQPALRDSPWTAEVLAEQSPLPGVKDPYLGYRLTSLTSRYTNIVDGVRTSYEPAVSGDRVSVWFFGSSALFGDGQRDDHTIPSEFARLAEADGIPVEVRNYGRPGTAMWQELELFEQVISTGQKPDLVVFYDGFNDLAWQMNVKLSTEPINIFDSTAGGAATARGTGADVAPPRVDRRQRHQHLRHRQRVLGPERVAPRLRRAARPDRGLQAARGAVRQGRRPERRRRGAHERRDLAGGEERDLDPGARSQAGDGGRGRRRGRRLVLLAAQRVHQEAGARRRGVPEADRLPERAMGSRGA